MKHPSILLVDDEENVLKSLVRLFDEEGFYLETATSGALGIEKLKSGSFFLIISDYRMPGMDGVSFLQQAKEIQPEAIRVMLTGFADMDAVIAAINQGEVYRYVSKPWREDELKALVKDCLHRFELTRQNNYLFELLTRQNEQLKELNKRLEQQVDQRTDVINTKNQQLSNLYEKLDTSFVEMVKIIFKTFGMRDERLAMHAKRVAYFSAAIAKKMGLDDHEVRDIEVGGLFHDIGKINMPPYILFKRPNVLTVEQRQILSQHSLVGSLAISGIERLKSVADMVLCHHEHINGGGFPYHRKGEDIPLGARIIAVADRFDNLTGGSIYGAKPLPNDEALAEIRRLVNEWFDGNVVAALAQVAELFNPPKSVVKLKLGIADLEEGMVLATNVHTQSGILIMSKNDVINEVMIEKLRQYVKIEPLQEDIIVFETKME